MKSSVTRYRVWHAITKVFRFQCTQKEVAEYLGMSQSGVAPHMVSLKAGRECLAERSEHTGEPRPLDRLNW